MTYDEFINNILNARGRHGCGNKYKESHHIKPKSWGGTNEDSNVIDLFPEEHFEVHRLLFIEHPNNIPMMEAFFHMSNEYGIKTGDEYADARNRHSQRVSEWNKTWERTDEVRRHMSENHADVSGHKNPNYGVPCSDEKKRKISIANSNPSENTRKKMMKYHKNRPPEHNKHISESMKGLFAGEKHPRCRPVYCPELDEEFWGAQEVENKYGIRACYITACLGGSQKSAGKHPVTGEKLTWKYVENNTN